MGTVLEKPVLLDETGQDIVDKLDEIKTAIGSTGEFIPVMIKVTTPPTKTTYGAGEALDLTGMVVELFGSNGARFDVTEQCTFSPAEGATLTNQDASVSVSYEWYKDQSIFTTTQLLTIKSLVSIAVTTPPTETEYHAGDELDLTGIVITATFDDATTQIITSQCTFSPANGSILTTSDNSINISATISGVTRTTTQSITVTPWIFGASWDGTSSSAWTRTDDAVDFVDPIVQMSDGQGGWTDGSSPFDNYAPWKDIKIVEDAVAGSVVEIPKYYFSYDVASGTPMVSTLKISDSPFEGSHVSPAHADRGDGQGERDVVYIGRYHNNSSYKSVSGAVPLTNQKRSEFRTGIHNLRDDIWQQDIALFWTVAMLYLVEFADWNSQNKIGWGCACQDQYTLDTSGATDAMTYHTGTVNTSKSNYGHNQYRHIEDLWGNGFEFLDGIWIDASNYHYIIINPNNFSDSAGGDFGGNPSAQGIPKGFYRATGHDGIMLPTSYMQSGSDYTIYCTDAFSYTSNYRRSLVRGGSINPQNLQSGLFYMMEKPNDPSRYTGGDANSAIGSRLMVLPNNT